MLKSMTGYGKAQAEVNNLLVVVEIKSLNSKFLETNIRLPKAWNDYEMEIRNLISQKLQRGKVNISVDVQQHGGSSNTVTYNQDLFMHYYNALNALAGKVGMADSPDLFRLALQQPEVATTATNSAGDEEWALIKDTLLSAIHQCDVFRTREGDSLRIKLNSYNQEIGSILSKIEAHDPQRIENIRQRLESRLEELSKSDQLDKSRLEQEMFFYIEKLDISEEKVRLRTHLNYFEQTLNSADSNGKKLGFLAQEIGREINTIGSKANDANVQQLVVSMKEELEKIKEQSLNVL
jgi:uncharacterized protein (TIGR00255 family)